jgi:hypothetical protein
MVSGHHFERETTIMRYAVLPFNINVFFFYRFIENESAVAINAAL